MAKNKNVAKDKEEVKDLDVKASDDVIAEDEIVKESVEEPKVKESKVPEVDAPEQKGKGQPQVKVKFIKDMPRLYIAGEYYSAKKGDSVMMPLYAAFVVKGADGKRESFAV